MCITSGKARLSDTLLYTGSAQRDNKEVHVLAYQNVAESLSDAPNAMILPFPTSEPMSEKNILDTSKFPNFLKDITKASKIQLRSLGMRRGVSFGAAAAKVFDVGSYTVVLAEKVSQIPEALQRVPESRRPSISNRFLIGFGKLYPDQPIAVCCWEGYVQAEPLLWWYVPTNKEVLFAPTMDAHDGNPPDTEAVVQTDHIISVGSTMEDRMGKHFRVNYSDSITSEARQLLPEYVYGGKMDFGIKNGDMFADAIKLGKDKSYRDIPHMYRGTSYSTDNQRIELHGWTD